MSNSATDSPTIPDTVWQARGRHVGPAAEDDLRRNLRRLKDSEVLDDFTEPTPSDDDPERVFEARWRVADEVTVRARLTLAPPQEQEEGRVWQLLAEAERPWSEWWPSPAAMFWPEADDASWDHHHAVADLRLGGVSPLPSDEKAMRRVIRNAARETWSVNVVVHEAMTPDERGRQPLAHLLPPGLRHRVVEHRAAPQQLRAVNWALRDLGVWVPRGGAVIVPPVPAPAGYDGPEYSVRSVFLDGSEPTELLDVLRRFEAVAKPVPQGVEEALTGLREQWSLLTLEEELARERSLVARYAEALEAMTKSRDLYRDAAEKAHEALAAHKDTPAPPAGQPGAPAASPFRQLTRTFERLTGNAKGLRPTATPADPSRDGDDSGEADRAS
ncbi:hypothetical protein ACWDG1_15410 [Streptomyces sp. NPDC001177]